jgi:hypothetical protein
MSVAGAAEVRIARLLQRWKLSECRSVLGRCAVRGDRTVESQAVGAQQEHCDGAGTGAGGVCRSTGIDRQTLLPDGLPRVTRKLVGYDSANVAIDDDPCVRISTQVQTPRWILRTPEISGRNSDVVLDRETQHGHRAGQAGTCSGRGQHDDRESRQGRGQGSSAAAESEHDPVEPVKDPGK